MKELKILLSSEKNTLDLGKSISTCLTEGLLIFLKGDLGAGKTTLARGLINGLGYSGSVKSPTYSLIEQYEFDNFTLNHFDLYRFSSPDEWVSSGFQEYITSCNITLIEWPEKSYGFLPKPDLEIKLLYKNQGRASFIDSFTPKGNKCLENL
ncbi:tRNA (adenosine(37)-N6)-threonylcarbamoyltransferase complex ATPase subunit type 1 TsaE [Methylophilaceae bacterium]|jgi:tRNA threonylcarbamoyladenosine biosynthesis protein TsaE|nr:tRNA (adenosine(37)-N6)-threonylcarbamoyltransferase complex ATPase subunit type 1 TsaE [Methylophilaceae bacterium]|tara:strand:+ start:3680 stop:4135 length:456 start_codon:yes stop_codon:yes gene_type:complete